MLPEKTTEELREELQALHDLATLVSPERRPRVERMVDEVQQQLDDLTDDRGRQHRE